MNEEWKVIEDYPNYSVSNLGRVRNNKTGYIRKPIKNIGSKGCEGYCYVMFKHPILRNVLVHRLVANAFIPNPDNKPQVNHKDGNKLNNCADNLEWVTGSENQLHSYMVLNRNRNAGSDSTHAKKVIRVEDGKVFNCVLDAAHDTGVKCAGNISLCLKNRNRTAGGYHWQYYEQEAL